jgi:hypothetical protein
VQIEGRLGAASRGASAVQSGGAKRARFQGLIIKNDLSDLSVSKKLLSIVVTTGTIYDLGAAVCEWALRV